MPPLKIWILRVYKLKRNQKWNNIEMGGIKIMKIGGIKKSLKEPVNMRF